VFGRKKINLAVNEKKERKKDICYTRKGLQTKQNKNDDIPEPTS
jgi:hypothetical protein